MKRRHFFKTTSIASASLLLPNFIKALGSNILSEPLSMNGKVLIVIQFSGGNDGLNTLVPFQNDLYYKNRPSISIRPNEVLKINDEAGFHPSLQALSDLYHDGCLSVISGVGYPNPNRSHFRSMDIWQGGTDADKYTQTGWLGRYLDAYCTKPYQGIEMDDYLSLALKGDSSKGMAFKNPELLFKNSLKHKNYHYNFDHDGHNAELDFLAKTLIDTTNSADYIYQKYKSISAKGEYPDTAFGKQLKTITSLIISGADIPVYYVSLGSFDTHVNQKMGQNNLFKQYSGAMQALVSDLRLANRFEDVAILTFSEFGRRVAENSGKGTDHGTANYVFVASGALKKPGLQNGLPNLLNLEDGDLIHTVDFRKVYATLLDNWLKADAELILGRQFDKLSFI